ncbi:hypothetical protein Tco_0774536, partial [Tanacetum coccineum]
AQAMRTASAAAKPCQGDSLEFYLIAGKARVNFLVNIVVNKVLQTAFKVRKDGIEALTTLVPVALRTMAYVVRQKQPWLIFIAHRVLSHSSALFYEVEDVNYY